VLFDCFPGGNDYPEVVLNRKEIQMIFFVKVRIDAAKLNSFALELQSGAIKTHAESSFCLKSDPSVGLNIWKAESRYDLDDKLSTHRRFYKEVIEISEVITPQESFKMLIAGATIN
jgi:hypothetical protein